MLAHKCSVSGCGKSFKNEWGLRVHSYRTHRDGNGNSSSISVTDPVVTKSLIIKKIVDILRDSPDNRISTGNLIQKLAESGITGKSRNSILRRIANAIRSNPQSGITRPGLGVLKLNAQQSVHVGTGTGTGTDTDTDASVDDLDGLSVESRLRLKEIELRRLRNRLATNHEIFAGMTRLLALSIMSQE